jgi:hypothetical protein
MPQRLRRIPVRQAVARDADLCPIARAPRLVDEARDVLHGKARARRRTGARGGKPAAVPRRTIGVGRASRTAGVGARIRGGTRDELRAEARACAVGDGLLQAAGACGRRRLVRAAADGRRLSGRAVGEGPAALARLRRTVALGEGGAVRTDLGEGRRSEVRAIGRRAFERRIVPSSERCRNSRCRRRPAGREAPSHRRRTTQRGSESTMQSS